MSNPTPQPNFAGRHPVLVNLACGLALVLGALLIYGRYLPKDHFTASGDFPPAASYVLNYRLAVQQGQWVPRLITIPRDVSLGLGSRDGTQQTADSPVYQYYSFGQSTLAYPFLHFGLPAIKAVQCAVVLAFSLSALALFAAGRLAGATRPVAFFAAYSYIISPWLVSNFYGRGGIAEAMGQAGLAFPVLGFACLISGRTWWSVIMLAGGIAWLVLSHNIFLLYGTVMTVALAAGLFVFPPAGTGSGWSARMRHPLIMGAGVAIGLSVTAWQWLPAAQSLGEIGFNYIGAFGEAGRVPQAFADWSGALGLPKQFVEPWSGQPREFFFTIGWWTIPGIVLLARAAPAVKPYAFAVVLGFAVFMLLILFPRAIYPHLPGPFGATQFNFRLLSFLSVLGAIGTCIAVPRLNPWIVAVAFVLVTLSQIKVITFPMPPGGGVTAIHEDQYVRGSEYSDFYPNAAGEKKLRHFYDGLLNTENTLNLHQRFWRQDGRNFVEDIADPATPVFVRVRGKLVDGLAATTVHLAAAGDPSRILSNSVEVRAGGRFEVTLATTAMRTDLHLAAAPTVKSGKRQVSIRPEEIFVAWGDPRSCVAADELQVVLRQGYQRVFAIPPERQSAHVADSTGRFTVEIPMIYSRFLIARQGDQTLATTTDFNHRLNVRATDLVTPIQIAYRLPLCVWLLTGLGLAAVLACLVRALRSPAGDKGRPAPAVG